MFFTKVISYEEGYQSFLKACEEQHPQENLQHSNLVIFRWDSLIYEYPLADEMLVFDSLAAANKNPNLHFVFVTEMEQKASEAFLQRNHATFRSAVFLYEMDDFISGVHYHGKKLPTQNDAASQKTMQNACTAPTVSKSSALYLLLSEQGELLYQNNNRFHLLKDSVFLGKLSALMWPIKKKIYYP